MPSTLVHLALGGLLAAALLGRAFGPRSLAVVLGTIVLVDLDVVLGLRALGPLQVVGAHRAAFHTLLLPALAAGLLLYDGRLREGGSRLVERFGTDAPRVAWVTWLAVVLAAIGPDAVTNGANLLYPVHDQFYAFDGRIRLSDQRGVVQTFVNLSADSGGGGGGGGGPNLDIDLSENAKGSSQETQYRTGVNPDPGKEASQEDPERLFLVVNSGLELLLVVTGTAVTAAKLRLTGER